MFCAISGEAPQTPFISTKSGLVYEGRLIRKYIDENGKEPTTGEPLKEEDLIEVKTNPRTIAPRPPTMSSIPALLSSLQNEYDAVMLEMFNLKKQYEGVRQELAHALYANDAANRVIARLMFERDQAREALVNVQSSLGGSVASGSAAAPVQDAEMAEPSASAPASASAIPEAFAATVDATMQTLSAERKAKSKRKALPEGYATADSISSFADASSSASSSLVKLGSARTAQTGINTLDVSPDGKAVLVGGNDKNVEVYLHDEGKSVAVLKGHKKPVIAAQFVNKKVGVLPVGPGAEAVAGLPAAIVSASEDGVVKVWKLDGETYSSDYDVSLGKDVTLTGLSVHPSGEYFALSTREGTLSVHSLTSSGEEILSVPAPTGEDEAEAAGGYAYECLQWHPDGQLIALGTTEGVVRVWDVKTLAKAATLRPASTGTPVSSLDFSENGYFLALILSSSGLIDVWDLRKLAAATTIEFAAGKPLVAKFDPSANYLGVAGEQGKVAVYANKTWKQLLSVDVEEGAELRALVWDARSGKIVTGGADRALRTFAAAA